MNNSKLTSLVSVFTLFGLSTIASAAPIVFSGADPGANSTDPRPISNAAAAAFDAAASVIGTNAIITFESAPVGPFSSLVVAPGVTLTGSAVGGGNQSINNTPVGTPDSLFGYNTTLGGANFAGALGGTLTFTFSTPTDFFGAYFSGVQDPLGGSLTLTFNDGSNQTIPFIPLGAGGGVEFLGFTDVGAMITAITFNSNFDITGVDDVRYDAGPNSVPDSGGTALLSGLALMGLFCIRRFGRLCLA
jgi:hypothetical protein